MILLSLNIYPVSMTIFLVVMVLRHIFFDVIHITIFKTDVMMMKNIFRAKPLWCCFKTIFKTDVMMMNYMLRVEPSLMFNINRTRGHDVKEVILPNGRRRWRKRDEPKGRITARRVFLLSWKTVHYNNHLSWYNLFVGYLFYRRSKTVLLKTVDNNTFRNQHYSLYLLKSLTKFVIWSIVSLLC